MAGKTIFGSFSFVAVPWIWTRRGDAYFQKSGSTHFLCPPPPLRLEVEVAASCFVARAPTHLSLRLSLISSAKISKVRQAGKMY